MGIGEHEEKKLSKIPVSERTHIAFAGKDHVGKSSLMNAFAGEELSKVSETEANTSGPVRIFAELQPFGPVVFIESAGLGEDKNFQSLASADFAIVVLDATVRLNSEEKKLFSYLDKIKVPYLIAANKIENGVNPELLGELKKLKKTHFEISCKEKAGIVELKSKLTRILAAEKAPPLLGDLLNHGDIVLMVMSDDLGAPPNENLLLTHVQAIRESLDEDTIVIMAKDKELQAIMNGLKFEPQLVITESQIVTKVAAEIPEHIKLTTFSILMARRKGNLPIFVRSIKRIEELQDGDKILIAEACDDHPLKDAVGREVIPKWITKHTHKNIKVEIATGDLFPENLSDYKLIVHCGGCMLTKHAMQTRIKQAVLLDIPIVNFGVINSYLQGAFPRVILPFEEALIEWKKRSRHSVLQV